MCHNHSVKSNKGTYKIINEKKFDLESVLILLNKLIRCCEKIVSVSLRLFSASIHFGNLKIASYYLHPQNEYLLEN